MNDEFGKVMFEIKLLWEIWTCLVYDRLEFQTNGMNGTVGSTHGLQDLHLTSGDQEARVKGNESQTSSQPESLTQPLETKTFPAELANHLEHIVGQLDILTQVRQSATLCKKKC